MFEFHLPFSAHFDLAGPPSDSLKTYTQRDSTAQGDFLYFLNRHFNSDAMPTQDRLKSINARLYHTEWQLQQGNGISKNIMFIRSMEQNPYM